MSFRIEQDAGFTVSDAFAGGTSPPPAAEIGAPARARSISLSSPAAEGAAPCNGVRVSSGVRRRAIKDLGFRAVTSRYPDLHACNHGRVTRAVRCTHVLQDSSNVQMQFQLLKEN